LRIIIVVVHVGVVEIYVAPMEAFKKKERHDETQFTTKIGEKLIWVPVICFVKFSFSIIGLMPYYVETSHSSPLIM
jgi:hypothetical protein